MGQLGQAAGAGVEGYLTQRDNERLQQAYAALEAGQPPELVAEAFKSGRPIPTGVPGQGGVPSPAPSINVPQMQQPNVVGRVIGPSSPLGGLAGPPPQVQYTGDSFTPRQPEMAQSAPGQSAPQQMLQRAPQQPQPQPQPQAQTRISQPAPQAAPQQQGGGMAQFMGAVTPRNMPLAQMMLQNRQQRQAQQVELAKARETSDLRASIEGMRDARQRDIAEANNETRAAIAEAQIKAGTERAQLTNNTNVMRILTQAQTAYRAIEARIANDQSDDATARARLKQDADLLKATTAYFAIASRSADEIPSPENTARQNAAEAALKALLASGGYDGRGVEVTPGETTVTKVPGIGGTSIGETTKKTTGAPSARVTRPGASPAPTPAPQSDTVTVTRKADGKSVQMSREKAKTLDPSKYTIR